MGLGNAAHDWEPQAGALPLAVLVHLIEAIPDVSDVLRGDARAVVANGQQGPVALCLERYAYWMEF